MVVRRVLAVPEETDNADERMDQFKGRAEEPIGAIAPETSSRARCSRRADTI
jgi:hypothetical protein